jgi:streptogramin lyase
VAPTDTITAAMNIAQHPSANVPAIWGLANSQATFQSTLSSAPTDWNLIVTYSGGGLSRPKGIAVDQSGNVWAANQGNNSVTKLDALGVTSTDTTGFLSGNSGYTVGALSSPVAVAIDLSGNAWVANNGNSSVTQIVASGTSGTVFNGGSLNAPTGVAVDASNNVWVANGGNSSVTEISSGGGYTNYPGSGSSGSGIASPTAIAINPK